jgi:EAL and modified HD-GYP domain-containing signal transduction protein
MTAGHHARPSCVQVLWTPEFSIRLPLTITGRRMFARRSPKLVAHAVPIGGLADAHTPGADLADRVHISRQPVIDAYERVTGYRVAYAVAPDTPPADGAMALFDAVLSVLGLERLVGESPAHLPISAAMLTTLGTPPIRPDRLLLRVCYEDAIEPALADAFDSIAARGYTMELADLPGPDFDLDLLDIFGIVEIDPASWAHDALESVVPAILSRRRTPLASNIPDHAARQAAQELGFMWFTGPFFGTPKVIKGRVIPTGNLQALASILQLQGEGVELEQVVEVIGRDVGLALRLLRYINSAYFGLAAKVNSIHEAALRLGSRGVARWALTMTVMSAPLLSPDVATLALTRARLCELLARDDALDGGEVFTVGLLSACDGVFNRPLETIIPELPLTRPVADALLYKQGPMGAILRMALAYERGDFGPSLLNKFGLRNARSYRDALTWAQATLLEA